MQNNNMATERNVRTFIYHFYDNNTPLQLVMSHVNLPVKIDYKHSYTFWQKYVYMSKATNMATVRNFDVICDKFNMVGIYTY